MDWKALGRLAVLTGAVLLVGFGTASIGEFYFDKVTKPDVMQQETIHLIAGTLATALGWTIFALMAIRKERDTAEQKRYEYRDSRDILTGAFLTQETIDAGLRRLALDIQEFVDQEDRKRKEFTVDPASPNTPDQQNELFIEAAKMYHRDTVEALSLFRDALNEAKAVRPDLRYYDAWIMYLKSSEGESETVSDDARMKEYEAESEEKPKSVFTDAEVIEHEPEDIGGLSDIQEADPGGVAT